MTIELVPLCTIDVTLREPIIVGEGPAGTRVIAEVEDLLVSGDRLSGHGKGAPGADLLTINGPVGTPDVHVTMETDDGAIIHITYQGRIDLSSGMEGAVVYGAPRFETGDERYGWLNAIQAVAKSPLSQHELHYEVYELR